MAGYWDLAAQYPSIVSNAAQSIAGAIAANRQRSQQARLLEFQKQQEANRAAQETRQLDLQEAGRVLEQQKIDAEAERNKQKVAAEQKFNYLASSYAKTQYPELRDAAKKQMYAVDPQKAQEFFKNELEMQPKPSKSPAPMSNIGQLVLDAGYTYGTPEFAAEVKKREQQARADELRKARGASDDSAKAYESSSKLRGEFQALPEVKSYKTVATMYDKIVTAPVSAAGDMARIFGIMKMMDPNSTVREGEYATAQNAGSVPQRIIAKYNAAVLGKPLEDDQRADFEQTAKKLFGAERRRYDMAAKNYTRIAKGRGLDPADIVFDDSGDSQQQPAQRPPDARPVTRGGETRYWSPSENRWVD